MLGFLFGFNTRITRLNYFLGTIALAVVMTMICFAIASYAFERGMRPTAESLMIWPVIAAGVVFLWATFTLQAMRIRDIGWDPVCVLPAWVALLIVDKIVAGKIPAWSLGQDHHGTIVGSVVNLVLFLALMFWPSGEYEDVPPAFGTPNRTSARSSKSDATSVAAARIARAATGTEFRRRAF